MSSFDIRVENLQDVLQRLDASRMASAISRGLDRWGKHLASKLAVYPPASGKSQPFVSARQRRWFFAALRSGGINVPYRRTGQLGRAWTSKKISQGEVQVVNATPYATWVQGRRQAKYHKGIWPFFGAEAEKTKDEGLGFIEDEVAKELDG